MKKKIMTVAAVLLGIFLVCWTVWANSAVELNVIDVSRRDLPDGFDELRIAHISDLHSASFWPDVVRKLREAHPDLICVTGDLMDRRNESCDEALAFMAEAVAVAPCYYVTGNHEERLPPALYRALMDGLESLGVQVLNDESVLLEHDGCAVSLTGHFWGETENIGFLCDHDGFRILLSHQPEDLKNYAKGDYDLVLTGHAHGGQFRLPFIGGLIAPGQGLFPEFDSGLYRHGNTDMIVSRGIGNSTVPLRLNNRPEVILVILKGEGKDGS